MRGVACEGLEVLSLRGSSLLSSTAIHIAPDVGRFSKEGSE